MQKLRLKPRSRNEENSLADRAANLSAARFFVRNGSTVPAANGRSRAFSEKRLGSPKGLSIRGNASGRSGVPPLAKSLKKEIFLLRDFQQATGTRSMEPCRFPKRASPEAVPARLTTRSARRGSRSDSFRPRATRSRRPRRATCRRSAGTPPSRPPASRSATDHRSAP